MRVASRHHPPASLSKDVKQQQQQQDSSAEQGGAVSLFSNSMIKALGKFREHHEVCARRRQLSAAYEIRMEAKRTEYLTRKYMDTLRQDHQGTACVGLHPNPPSSSSSTSSSTKAAAVNTHSCPTSNGSTHDTAVDHSKEVANNSQDQESIVGLKLKKSPPHSPAMDSHSATEDEQKPFVSSSLHSSCSSGQQQRGNKQSGGGGNFRPVMVKMEPGVETSSGESSCSRPVLSKQYSSSSSPSATSKPSSAGSNKISSETTSKGKLLKQRRSSKDLPMHLPMAQSSTDDAGNDLALTVDDIFTGKIGGTPLLKPLEEEDDEERTSDIVQSPSVAASVSSNGVSSPAVRTHVNNTALSNSAKPPPKDTELRKELDLFSMVMDKVERVEKAKERRASQSSFPFPPPGTITPAPTQGSPIHLISPPPYTSTAQPTQPLHSLPSNEQHSQLRQYLTGATARQPSHDSTYSSLANTHPSNTTTTFAKPHSLPLSENLYAAPPSHLQHHHPTTSPHTPVLISPTTSHMLPCSSSHPLPPTPTTPYDPITAFHHQPAPPPRPSQIQPSPDYSQPLNNFSTPQPARNQMFSYNMAEPSDPSWNQHNVSYHQFIPGKKRPISSSQYMPPAKVPLSTIAQLPNGNHGNQMLGHYLTNHTGVTSYPNEPPPYPHM